MQLRGPSQKVTSPLQPCGSSDGGGTPPGTSQRSGLNSAASGPQTAGLTCMVVNGIWKTYGVRTLVSKMTAEHREDTRTCPAATRSDVMLVPSLVRTGLLSGITSSLRATRSVWGEAGYRRSLARSTGQLGD